MQQLDQHPCLNLGRCVLVEIDAVRRRHSGFPELQREMGRVQLEAHVGRKVRGHEHPPVRVGFAAETEDLLEHASQKLARKSLDLIVANDVSGDVFGSDDNEVTLLWRGGVNRALPRMPKTEVAEHVLDAVRDLLSSRAA